MRKYDVRWMALAGVLAILAALPGCSSCCWSCGSDPEPVAQPAAGDYQTEWDAFETAYDELRASMAATPNWVVDKRAFAKVRGQGRIASQRAEALEPFARTGTLSSAVPPLAKEHIADIARLRYVNEPRVLAAPQPTAEENLRYNAEEAAYVHVVSLLPLLERYAADGIRNDWLETHALSIVIPEARRVMEIEPATRRYWNALRVDPDECFEMHRARIDGFLAAWERMSAAPASTARG